MLFLCKSHNLTLKPALHALSPGRRWTRHGTIFTSNVGEEHFDVADSHELPIETNHVGHQPMFVFLAERDLEETQTRRQKQ